MSACRSADRYRPVSWSPYQFLRDWALPHFHFHVATAYGILRHLGLELGKRDYMRSVGKYIRQRPK